MALLLPATASEWSTLIAATLAAVPPPVAGFVRLYRVEASASATLLAPWLSEALEQSGALAAAGRWFTDDPSALAFYAADAPSPPCLVYGDAPVAQVEQWPVASFSSSGKLAPQRFSRDPGHEFFAPAEWARSLPRHALTPSPPVRRPRC